MFSVVSNKYGVFGKRLDGGHIEPYSVRDMNFVMKLEPIVDILNNRVHSYEILSKVDGSSYSLNNDIFFKCLTKWEHVQLLQRQLERFQKLSQQDSATFSSVFINVSLEQFCDTTFEMELYPFSRDISINIEIETDPNTFLSSKVLSSKSRALSERGLNIWLDDIDVLDLELSEKLILSHKLAGVKISKESFWDAYEKNISFFFPRINKKIIVEGIESEGHRLYLAEQKINFAQGFLWSKKKSNVNYGG